MYTFNKHKIYLKLANELWGEHFKLLTLGMVVFKVKQICLPPVNYNL